MGFFKQHKPELPPIPLPLLVLGTRSNHGKTVPVTLSTAQSALSVHASGVSGSGKSSWLLATFLQLLRQQACALIDPAGDLAEATLTLLIDQGFFADPRAFSQLLYVKWRRNDWIVPYDVLAQRGDPYTVAANVAEVFRRAWPALDHGQAASFENTLLFSLAVLIANRAPLTALLPLISSKATRERLLAQVTDAHITAFFRDRFEGFGAAMTESTARRLNLLLFNPVLRFSLSQAGRHPLDFHTLLRAGTSVIHDISGLDEDSQRFLGCLLTVNAEQATLALADVPTGARRPYTICIDEWPAFMTTSVESFERLLAMARKERVRLILANQTASQIPKGLRGALGNAGIELAFRQSPEDAAAVASRFTAYDPERFGRPRSPGGSLHYASLAEQREATQLRLQRLPNREALLRQGDRIEHVRALDLPRIRATRLQVQAIADRYAELLGRPLAVVQAEVERMTRTDIAGSGQSSDGVHQQAVAQEAGRGVFVEP